MEEERELLIKWRGRGGEGKEGEREEREGERGEREVEGLNLKRAGKSDL